MTRQIATQTQQQTPTTNTLSRGSILQRKCESCGQHTIAGGECAGCAKEKSVLQRKLTIGASNDPLEGEADRVAEQVMAAPTHSGVSGALPRIQRYVGQATEDTDIAPASVERVLAGSGRPLESLIQQDMEQRFGHDFSRVRVHTDGDAERSAQDINANAYTVGHDIVFGAGRFAPGTNVGRRLIAHELTHVVQQGSERYAGSVRSKMLQRSLNTYIKAMQGKPEPDWKTAAEHLNGTSSQKIKIILKNLSPHYRAKLHEAARVSPGLCSNIGRFTEADYLKEHPETTDHVADACDQKSVPPVAPSPTPPSALPTPSASVPPTPKGCSASGAQRSASGCTPNIHGAHLPDVGGTHTESHPFEPCKLTQAAVAASPKWCVDAQQFHGGEICYREIPSTGSAPGAQYCYSLNCCHDSADEVSVVEPTSPGSNSCCQTNNLALPEHFVRDVIPEAWSDPTRVSKDMKDAAVKKLKDMKDRISDKLFRAP